MVWTGWSSFSSNHPGAKKQVRQVSATTFAFSSVFILLTVYDYDCDLLNNGLFISGSGGGLDRTAHQPNLCRQGITVHIRWWDKPHNAYMYTVQYCTFSQGPCYEKSMVRQLALHFCYPTSRSYNFLYLCSGEPRLALTHTQFWNAQMSINVKLDLLMPLKNLVFPLCTTPSVSGTLMPHATAVCWA